MGISLPRALRLGEIYRFGAPAVCPPDLEFVDGCLNWFFVTDSQRPMDRGLRPQAGIWNPLKASQPYGDRTPVIICSSASHQVGSAETPWADVIRPDDGFAIYYGDNKDATVANASEVRGNREMLDAMRLHHAGQRALRLAAPPILIVSSRDRSGPAAGFRTVEGLALIRSADVVLQRPLAGSDGISQGTFQNLRFDLVILDLKESGDSIPMDWVNARRDPTISDEEAAALAPPVWKRFIDEGISVLESAQRRVMRSALVEEALQRPQTGSKLEDILLRTLAFFSDRRHDFEAVSARVVERIYLDQGLSYRTGWITQRSGDGGYDFVGCLDLDRTGQFPSTRQVVLGQSKCETSATSGRDVARLAARLRRGWQGAYVTTSTFSRRVQREVIEDRFPILLVPGIRVASVIQDEVDQSGLTLGDYLGQVAGKYRTLSRASDPELVLLD